MSEWKSNLALLVSMLAVFVSTLALTAFLLRWRNDRKHAQRLAQEERQRENNRKTKEKLCQLKKFMRTVRDYRDSQGMCESPVRGEYKQACEELPALASALGETYPALPEPIQMFMDIKNNQNDGVNRRRSLFNNAIAIADIILEGP